MKKYILALALVTAGASLLVPGAHAATTDSMTITVTIGGTLDIDLDFGNSGTFTFSNPGVSASTVTSRAIVIKNTSTTLTEDWQIDCSTFTANWAIVASGTPSADQFGLSGQLAPTEPATSDTNWTRFDATTSFQNMSASAFTNGSLTGNNVPAQGTRNMWFKLDTPSSVSNPNDQSITVRIQAVTASTF